MHVCKQGPCGDGRTSFCPRWLRSTWVCGPAHRQWSRYLPPYGPCLAGEANPLAPLCLRADLPASIPRTVSPAHQSFSLLMILARLTWTCVPHLMSLFFHQSLHHRWPPPIPANFAAAGLQAQPKGILRASPMLASPLPLVPLALRSSGGVLLCFKASLSRLVA